MGLVGGPGRRMEVLPAAYRVRPTELAHSQPTPRTSCEGIEDTCAAVCPLRRSIDGTTPEAIAYSGRMSIAADHKALVFLGIVAVLGAGVRITRTATRDDPATANQPALTRQLGAADSAARAGRRGASPKSRSSKTGSGRGSTAAGRATHGPPSSTPVAQVPFGRPGYLYGKLDFDVATAAQIDSLPGIGPSLANRIVSDRAAHGPFLNFQGLRRVSGVGPVLLKRLDTLVTFSGALRPLSAAPESVSAQRARPRPHR